MYFPYKIHYSQTKLQRMYVLFVLRLKVVQTIRNKNEGGDLNETL